MKEKKKVILISPRNVAWTGAVTLPLNLAYLASSLEQEGHEVKCADMRINPNADIQEEIRDFDVVGISSCTPSIKETWRIAKVAKKEGKTVILGGPHPTALPEESLQKSYVDIVVRGEGEETIKEVCREVDLKNIKGISFKKNNRIVHNEARSLIKDLDLIPFPARHLFDLKKYHAALHKNKIIGDILTSRGCPYGCNFCFKAIFGRLYRVRSPKNVIAEWKQMLDMGIEEIGILDDNFAVDQKRSIKICDEIKKQKLVVDWSATGGIRVDNVSRELLKAMKSSGCYRICLGAESGSQYILDKNCKGIKLEQVKNAVRLAKEFDLETVLFFIIGNLYEDEKTMQMTIDFAKELNPDYVQFTVATPYPGTTLYDIVKREGKLLVKNWEEYGSYEGKAYFEHEYLKGETVERMYRKAYRDFYLRPRTALKYIRDGRFEILQGFRFLLSQYLSKKP
jgi:radical SAM superfamily enzyme YgiQ (UPF0313 family)